VSLPIDTTKPCTFAERHYKHYYNIFSSKHPKLDSIPLPITSSIVIVVRKLEEERGERKNKQNYQSK
jgi:hypothetical protein